MNILMIDSNSELWYDTTKALGLPFIKMPYTIDGQEYYYDLGENTYFDDFYRRMRSGSVPITSALNKYDYIDYFEPYLSRGDDILYLTFSHHLSATFSQMDIAIQELKEKYPDRTITTFDTRSISMGAGILNYYTALEFAKHRDIAKTLAFAEEFRKHAACYFVVDDLHHLKRGGRISGVSAVMGTLLGIKPLIKVNDEGKLVNIEKIKGEKRVISRLVEIISETGEKLDEHNIYVLHADNQKAADALAASLRAEFGEKQGIITHPVGPVIATHCGPGTIGIAFHAKQR